MLLVFALLHRFAHLTIKTNLTVFILLRLEFDFRVKGNLRPINRYKLVFV